MHTRSSTKYREAIVLRHVEGKDVLDCGGVDHTALEMKQARGNWLHSIVAARARSCVGVGILEDRVRAINEVGVFNFVVANVESLPFENQFDVVLAGEIAEHVYNMGLFLDSAWKALRRDGTLVITTPNAYALTALLFAVLLGKERCHPEHTCYYSPQTLCYTVEHHGFTVEELHLLPRPARSRLTQLFRRIVCRIRPILSETLVLVSRKCPIQDKYCDKW